MATGFTAWRGQPFRVELPVAPETVRDRLTTAGRWIHTRDQFGPTLERRLHVKVRGTDVWARIPGSSPTRYGPVFYSWKPEFRGQILATPTGSVVEGAIAPPQWTLWGIGGVTVILLLGSLDALVIGLLGSPWATVSGSAATQTGIEWAAVGVGAGGVGVVTVLVLALWLLVPRLVERDAGTLRARLTAALAGEADSAG